ncbi:hypothetical protein QJS04_geneDACA009519 [Acorus gramineus]|uniref:Jacalin-type lectin domain-containing protein n=1 Tax=Acorus gramineus TaxID=55184 RepID=A0AAV9AH00_ACOGR|nr:hypothetical protein QJS04_geneDACA009519 [Acorus gramineus]
MVAAGLVVDSLQFKYNHDGTSLWSLRQGGSGGTSFKVIIYHILFSFNFSFHFIPSNAIYDGRLIKSLTFYTNVGTKYGPYGTQDGTFFSSSTNDEIVGFFGRSGDLLDEIGIYVSPRIHSFLLFKVIMSPLTSCCIFFFFNLGVT